MTRLVIHLLAQARESLERRLLGVTAAEIRYTFEDVRGEIRATRAELLREIARLRDDVERLAAGDPQRDRAKPVAEA